MAVLRGVLSDEVAVLALEELQWDSLEVKEVQMARALHHPAKK